MNAALKYSDMFVRVPLGCDVTRLVELVKSMGGTAVSIPEVGVEKKATKSSSELTSQMLKKHCGAWAGDESPEEIMASIRSNSTIRKPVEF